MKIDEKIVNRLQELIEFESQIEQTRVQGEATMESRITDVYAPIIQEFTPSFDCVDASLANQWGVSCLQIVKNITSEESEYYKKLNDLFSQFTTNENYFAVKIALGVIKAVKYDYENGYLFDTRTLIEAKVFDDFLEQAEELFKKTYYQPAAVIAGCVLEDSLRKLCTKNSITFQKKPTIEPMNIELAKIGVYNQFIKDNTFAKKGDLKKTKETSF